MDGMGDDTSIFPTQVKDGRTSNNKSSDDEDTNNNNKGIDSNDINLDVNSGTDLSKEEINEIEAEFAKKAAKEREKENKKEKEKEDEEKEKQRLKEKREDKENKEKNDKKQEKRKENNDAVSRFLKKVKDMMDGSSMINAKEVGSLDGNEKDNKSAITKNAQNADRHEKTQLGDLFSSLSHSNVVAKGLDALKAKQPNKSQPRPSSEQGTADKDQRKNKQNAEKRNNENKQRDDKIKQENEKRTADLAKKRQEAEKEIAEARAREKAKRLKKSEESEQEYQNDLKEIDDKYNKKIAKINDAYKIGDAYINGHSPEDAFSRLSEDGRQEIINTRSNSKEKDKFREISNDITAVKNLPDTSPKVNRVDKNNITDPSKLNINAQIDPKKESTNSKKTDLKQETTEAQAKFNAAVKKAEQQQNTQLKPNNTNPINGKNGVKIG